LQRQQLEHVPLDLCSQGINRVISRDDATAKRSVLFLKGGKSVGNGLLNLRSQLNQLPLEDRECWSED
jgi:hypothetical protein